MFDDAETKTRQHIEFKLPPAVVLMINEYLATRSPFLCPSGTGWLFPQRDGVQQMAYARMSDKISKRVKKELGLDFNPHLFRHLAAKVFLDARPGSYEAMRRILGHSSTSSTLNAYAGLEAGTATTLFAQVISKAKRP